MRSTMITLAFAALLAQANGTGAAAKDADPCTFFSKSEIESAFGLPFGPPKKGSTITGPMCMFYTPSIGTISIRFANAVTRAQFDSLPTMLGTIAEPVSGVGETAFFWGNRLFVFDKGRQFVVGVSGEMTPRLRTALITLGKLGVPRLRG
jgi:hypothetical protein